MMCCRLCHGKVKLENSHIIPKFIYKWIKTTSPAGGLRSNYQSPNIRKQDGLITPFLCSNCEDLFEKNETYFSKAIFYPTIEEKLHEVSVTDDLIGFCLSVIWRSLKYRMENKYKINELTDIEIEKFNLFLKDVENYFNFCDKAIFSKYKIHIIPTTSYMEDKGLIPKLTFTNQRGTDSSFRAFCSEKEGYDYLVFYVKIPYFLLVAEAEINEKYIWGNSDVLHESIVLNQDTVIINSLVIEIIETMYDNKKLMGQDISQYQIEKITNLVKNSIANGISEKTYNTIQAKIREIENTGSE